MNSERITAYTKLAATVIGLILAFMSLAGAMNQALLDHLDRTFATKNDLARVREDVERTEHKVDDILSSVRKRR